MKKYGINEITTTLIHLLNDDKRDGIILLDGQWGTGKTFFIKEILKSTYSKKPIFLVSMMGVTSLEEFTSELLRECYIKLPDEIKQITNIANAVIAVSAKIPGVVAPINKAMEGVGNVIKKYKLSTIEGVFVIDDIERIDKKLASEILGYCHSTYMKNDKIDFIIVSNTSKESSFKVEHKEKIISDTVPFIPEKDDIYILFEEKLKLFGKSHALSLKRNIEKYKIVNIRIINKIISGLYPFFLFHKENPEKEIKANLDLIISSFCALVILSKQYNYTLPKIESTRKKEESELDVLLEASTATGVPHVVREYAFSIASERDVIEELFYDKKKIDINEIVLSDSIISSGLDESVVVKKLLDIVYRKEEETLKVWEKAVSNYKNLVSQKYIMEDPKITNDFLMEIADSYKKEDALDAFYIESNRQVENIDIEKARNSGDIRKYITYKYSYDERPVIEDKIRQDILLCGWSLFNTERLIKKHSPLQFIGVEQLYQAIIKNWKVIDIISFKNYLYNLYNFTNIHDYLSGELTYLEILSEKLKEYTNNNSASFLYGSINSLAEVINQIIRRLKK